MSSPAADRGREPAGAGATARQRLSSTRGARSTSSATKAPSPPRSGASWPAPSTPTAPPPAAGRRFNRSRIQCQKRVYTLKDQYKELSKQAPSGWRHFSQLQAVLASPDGPPPGFPTKMPESTVKKDDETEVEVIGGVSGLAGRSTVPAKRHFSSLQEAILANLYGPPPCFPAKTPALVKEEEMVGGGCGLVGSGVAAGCCPASVVTKLAGVYERVEMARLNVEEKMEMEREKIACWKNLGVVKVEKLDETDHN